MSKRSQIHQEIESLSQKLQSTNQVLASRDELSMLDIDLLRKTTIEIYDLVNNLRLVMHEKSNLNLEAELEAAKALAAEAEAKAKAELAAAQARAAEAEEKARLEAEKAQLAEAKAKEEAMLRAQEVKDEVVAEEYAASVEEPILEEPIVVEEPEAEMATEIEEPVAEAEPMIEEEIIPAEEPTLETAAPKNTPAFDEEPTDLAGKFSATPIADIKQSISIAKKFEYINTLFQGNVEKYSRTIVNLNSMRNGDEAFEELNRLRRELEWEEEDANYLELANLIRRRYLG